MGYLKTASTVSNNQESDRATDRPFFKSISLKTPKRSSSETGSKFLKPEVWFSLIPIHSSSAAPVW